MIRTHCDNCDSVLQAPPTSEALQTVLRDGTIVHVETLIFHPVTHRRLELCAGCHRDLLNTATQPYMQRVGA